MIALLGVSISDAEACDKEGSCSPMQRKSECLQKCQKNVAEEFKGCADSVTLKSNVQNDEGLNKCKEFAKEKNKDCKRTCSQERSPAWL